MLTSGAGVVISAAFSDGEGGTGIDTASVRLYLDGMDVTAQATVTATGISYTPNVPLVAGGHVVVLTVRDLAGNPATTAWAWRVFAAPPTDPRNPALFNLVPAPGSVLGGNVVSLAMALAGDTLQFYFTAREPTADDPVLTSQGGTPPTWQGLLDDTVLRIVLTDYAGLTPEVDVFSGTITYAFADGTSLVLRGGSNVAPRRLGTNQPPAGLRVAGGAR